MKNNRLDVILQRNQQSVVLDVLLAIVFLVAAMTTGVAMRTAFGQLGGVPVAAAVTRPDGPLLTGRIVPCAERGTTQPLPPVLI